MTRPGVITWNMLYGNASDIKKYLLLYDELWVPWLLSSHPTKEEIETWSLDKEHLASIDWLTSEGLLREPPLDLVNPQPDDLVRALAGLLESTYAAGERGYRGPDRLKKAAIAGGVYYFNEYIALSRLTTHLLWRDYRQLAYPVFFPFDAVEAMPGNLKERHNVLSVVLKRFPAITTDVPLQDIVAFKRDLDTPYKFARFWNWTRKMSQQHADAHELEEELDSLINDYSQHLKQLTAETGHERLEIFLATPGDLIEDVMKLRWGNLARRLLQLRKTKISAHGAEMKLPGSEIAYVTEATRVLSVGHGRS